MNSGEFYFVAKGFAAACRLMNMSKDEKIRREGHDSEITFGEYRTSVLNNVDVFYFSPLECYICNLHTWLGREMGKDLVKVVLA